MEPTERAEPVEPPPVSPLTALRRHWVVSFVLIVLAAAAGTAFGLHKTVTYTAQARLAVGGQQLANFQIPGFALASQEVASNYARYVGLPQAQRTFRAALGADSAKVFSVSASPIATSNIIMIETSATSSSVAVSAADAVATSLMTEANSTDTPQTAAYLTQFQSAAAQYYALQAQLTAARTALATLKAVKVPPPANLAAQRANQVVQTTLQTKLAVVSVQQQTLKSQYQDAVTGATGYSQLVSAQTAVITVISRDRTVEKYGLAGLVLGLVLALIVSTLLENRRTRRAARVAGARSRPVAEARTTGQLATPEPRPEPARR